MSKIIHAGGDWPRTIGQRPAVDTVAEVDALRAEIAQLKRELKTVTSSRDGFRNALQQQQARNVKLESEIVERTRFDEISVAKTHRDFMEWARSNGYSLLTESDGCYSSQQTKYAFVGWFACFKELTK